ncbi:hypothetical protein NE237_030292 [Protea cynaroides]|uniref:Uncharacterized protein n=1 Tax=Protea cynaroides TaxID=273540 RepID=A0A9Q0GTY2_9MAGN|nr:hypothetical protein NE237_030292 [Protea cynaroides]
MDSHAQPAAIISNVERDMREELKDSQSSQWLRAVLRAIDGLVSMATLMMGVEAVKTRQLGHDRIWFHHTDCRCLFLPVYTGFVSVWTQNWLCICLCELSRLRKVYWASTISIRIFLSGREGSSRSRFTVTN